jgi:ABC-type glycerol-3-phosphate transport system substrate-binding protein
VPSGLSRLAAGTAVANIAGQWILTGAIQNAPEVVEHLVVRPPLRQRRQLINVFNNWFGIGSQSKYMDLAWELLLHFNQPDNLLEYCRLVGSAVPRRSLRDRGHMTDPRYQMKAWIEIVEQYARPHPLIVAPSVPVGGKDMRAVLTEAIHNVRQGKQGPKEALDEAARNWQLQLDAAYRELGL